MNRRLLVGLATVALATRAAGAQSAGTDAFLSQLELDFSQYSERMGFSLWAFNQNMAQAGMGSSREVTARGEQRIAAGRATVTYRPVAATLADEFAKSRSADPAKQKELVRVYEEDLRRFRDAQTEDGLGTGDVASALGLAFASYYEIYSNGEVPNPAQERDVAEQFRQSLLKNAYFQGTTDRYRQLLDENTAVQTVASLVSYRNAARLGDEAAIAQQRREALAFLDFYWPGDVERAQRIRLTPAGFRE